MESYLKNALTRRSFVKGAATAGAVLFGSSVLIGCTTDDKGEVGSEDTKATTAFIEPIAEDPQSNNFAAQAAEWDNHIWELISHPMLHSDYEAGVYAPLLVASWEASSDGKTVTFKLTDGIKWQDGEPFTTDDVIWSWNYFLQDGFSYPNYWGELAPEGSVPAKVDDLTFTVTTPEPALEQILGYFSLYYHVIPKHYWEDVAPADFLTDEKASKPVGLGAFIFDEYKIGEFVRLKANPDYFRGKPEVDEYILRIIPDTSAQLQAFESGELSFTALTLEDYDRLKDNPNYQIISVQGGGTGALLLNEKNPALANIEVRKALAYLLDKQTYVDSLFSGQALAADGIFPPSVRYYNESAATKYPFSIEKAKSTLEAAGYTLNADGIYEKDGIALAFSLTLQQDGGYYKFESIALILQQDAAEVGIKLDIQTVDSSVWQEVRKDGTYDIGTGGYNLGIDVFSYSSITSIYSGQTDFPELDALWTELAQAEAGSSAAQRTADQITTYISENVLFLPIIRPSGAVAFQNNVDTSEAVYYNGTWGNVEKLRITTS